MVKTQFTIKICISDIFLVLKLFSENGGFLQDLMNKSNSKNENVIMLVNVDHDITLAVNTDVIHNIATKMIFIYSGTSWGCCKICHSTEIKETSQPNGYLQWRCVQPFYK